MLRTTLVDLNDQSFFNVIIGHSNYFKYIPSLSDLQVVYQPESKSVAVSAFQLHAEDQKPYKAVFSIDKVADLHDLAFMLSVCVAINVVEFEGDLHTGHFVQYTKTSKFVA